MMVKFSMDSYLMVIGVPIYALEKVKSTILTWFVIGFLSGVCSGIWLLAMIIKYR
jgi:hypothetical protein